jgi:hypothetical protein
MLLTMVLSLMLLIMSIWSLNTFSILDKVSKTYKGPLTFAAACNLTKEHVLAGLWISKTVIILSLCIFAVLGKSFYNHL